MVHSSFFKNHTEEQLNEIARDLLKDPSFDCLSWSSVGPLLENPCISLSNKSAQALLYGDSYLTERKKLTVSITEAFIIERTVNGNKIQQNN